MGLVVVTGYGPRTGTSWLMTKAIEYGLPVSGIKFPAGLVVPEHNPDGYWETIYPNTVPDKHVVKLWGHALNKIDDSMISRVVLLERYDKKKQYKSLIKVFKDEKKLFPDLKIKPRDLFQISLSHIRNWLDKTTVPIYHVYTEELTKNLDNTISYMRGGL